MAKDATDQPERFKRAVRAACCDACNWPDCGCETTADIARKAINAWNAEPPIQLTGRDAEVMIAYLERELATYGRR